MQQNLTIPYEFLKRRKFQQPSPQTETPMPNPFDLTRARAETPGCAHVMHFNNAGAGLMPQPVLDAQLHHLQLEAEIGGYEAAWQEEAKIEHTYDAIAQLLNAHRDEIAVVENATMAWQMAFGAIQFQAGDRILTAQASYVSNYLNFLLTAERTGAIIDVIPNDEGGQLSLNGLREMMDERVKLIAITHVPTNGGLVNPAAEVGQIAQEYDCLYLLDGCQSAGQLPLDVEAIGCDLLSATGRKFLRGPRGSGFLYARKSKLDQLIPPFIDLHSAEWTGRNQYKIRPDGRRFENWENNYAAKIGLGVAVDYALSWEIDITWKRLSSLAAQLREGLSAIPAVTVHDIGRVKGGIVTFNVAGQSADAIQQTLATHKINTTTSTVTSTRLDMEARHIQELVRASVHYYNTEAEVARFCEIVEGLAQK